LRREEWQTNGQRDRGQIANRSEGKTPREGKKKEVNEMRGKK
jgi:hypothetical protein